MDAEVELPPARYYIDGSGITDLPFGVFLSQERVTMVAAFAEREDAAYFIVRVRFG